MEPHEEKVNNISRAVKKYYAAETKVRINHGSTNSTRSKRLVTDAEIDTSSLDNVLEVNVQEKYALAEPNVSMEKLVDEALKYGMIPAVVMEFPGITVGGGIQGGAGESSSFKYGLFHDTCIEYEMVLGNGEIISASREQNSDLFWGTACSYGSLGIITLAKIRLIPSKKYVRLTYHRTEGIEDAVSETIKKTKTDTNFVDGVMFDKNLGVVMTADLSDKVDLPVSRFSRAYNNWFYLHAQKITNKFDTYEELMPIKEYLFRYDRGGFWGGMHFFKRYNLPFNRITRFLLDPLFKTRRMYKLFNATQISQQYIVQDISVPGEKTIDFIKFIDAELRIYPLWLCPLKPGSNDKLSPTCIESDMVINVGVWGGEYYNFSKFYNANRVLEKKTTLLGGRKVLYAHAYYPEKEFWSIYDKAWYDSLREKYKAKACFPNIYRKVFVSEKYEPGVRKGVKKLVREFTGLK